MEYLKDFFKFESSKLREDGKVEIEFSCFKCQTNQKEAILKTSSIDATPYNLQFHMKKVHPQLGGFKLLDLIITELKSHMTC